MNYSKWIVRFQTNKLNRPEPDWHSPRTLTEAKRQALVLSLAEYQLGDGGGPCRLIAHDAETVRAERAEKKQVIDLWFAEEKEHSRLLGDAVRRLEGAFVEDTFAFRMFNRCRRVFDAQFEMLVLLIVEIVSTGYYRLIRRHCDDAPIAAMCGLILRDEAGHIAFHRDRLASLYPEGTSFIWRLQFYLLGFACTTFLWLGHGRWLRVLGAKRAELFGQVTVGLYRFLRQLQPKKSARPASELATAPQGIPLVSA